MRGCAGGKGLRNVCELGVCCLKSSRRARDRIWEEEESLLKVRE